MDISRDDDPLGIGGGHIEPMSPVEVAAMKLGENPIWLQNRPGHWGRGKNALYYGVWVASVSLALVAILGETLYGPFPLRMLVAFSVLICLVQCLSTFALIFAFNFLKGREGALEAILLTRLGMSDIAYGSLGAGARASLTHLMPLFLAEFWLWARHDVVLGAYAFVLLFPFRWLVYCHAMKSSLARLTSTQSVDPSFLVALPFLSSIQAGLCVFLGFLLIPVLGFVLGPRGNTVVEIGTGGLFFIPVGYVLTKWWGRATLTGGWRAATENLYKRMEM